MKSLLTCACIYSDTYQDFMMYVILRVRAGLYRLLSEAYRLVAPEEMGSLYKVMAITPKILTHSRSDTVPGFEGIDSVTTNTAGDLETPT